MATVSNLSQYLTAGAIEGFIDAVAPLTAFGYVVKPGGAGYNDVVRVPFAQNTSASNAFTVGTGYASDGNTITGKSITLDKLLYQRISLTDSDLLQLNDQALMKVGSQAGRRLGVDFVSASLASTALTANFSNQATTSGSVFSSSAAIVALDKQANDLKWPDGERTLIANSTLWLSLLSNSNVTTFSSFGSAEPIQAGVLRNVLGFTPYRVSFTLPESNTGYACNTNGLLFANAYHTPQDSGQAYTAVKEMTDEKTGLTIGYREWYDQTKASRVRVFDVLGGVAVGDGNGIIRIK